jgi:hypothetical protein
VIGDSSVRDAVVEGLTAEVPQAEREAARTPPYPLPAAQRASRDRLVRVLVDRLPAEGNGPLTVTRVRGTPIPYRNEVASLQRPGRFDFGDAACALLAVGALDDADVEALAELLPRYCGFRRQQVLNRLALDALDEARAAAARVPDGLSWVAYRDIAGVLADRGDTKGFFADWKHYEARQDRAGMTELKRRLVVGVARKDGWQAALAVTRDKRVGPEFARFAFDAFLDGDVEGLRRLFAGAAAGVLSEEDELTMLARAVRAASGHNPETDHPLLGEIVDRIIAVDPTTDKATMRWRDGQLFALWPAYGEQATLDRVRSAVRTPRYKRELTTLARDLGR